jgi:hypothetical protein
MTNREFQPFGESQLKTPENTKTHLAEFVQFGTQVILTKTMNNAENTPTQQSAHFEAQ